MQSGKRGIYRLREEGHEHLSQTDLSLPVLEIWGRLRRWFVAMFSWPVQSVLPRIQRGNTARLLR
jgi:hypothetical protein